MSGFTRNFDAAFDMTSGRFAEEKAERAKPRFWVDEILNRKTNELEKIEMVEIRVPGEDKNVWAGKVTDAHRQRFPRYYEAFKKGEDAPVYGHALEKLPGITHQLVSQLKFMGFTSAEDLAKATDQAIGQFHAGLTWRRKAQLWLDEQRALESAANSSTQKDALIAEQARALEALQAQMAQLSAQMSERKKPGRKPKAEQVAA